MSVLMASIFSVNRKMRSSAENRARSGGHWRKKEKVQTAILERSRVTRDCSRIVGQGSGSAPICGLPCKTRTVQAVVGVSSSHVAVPRQRC